MSEKIENINWGLNGNLLKEKIGKKNKAIFRVWIKRIKIRCLR